MITITTPPAQLVTLAEAKVALGESGSDRDTLINAMILAAQAELDGPNGWVGVCVAEQTAQIKASSFDEPEIRLVGGPITDVAVTYLDSDGDTQTLDDQTYIVGQDGVLSLVYGEEWPTVSEQADCITVSYDVGIADTDDPRVNQMKIAIIMHVRMTLDMVAPDVHRRAIEALVRPMWVVP